MSASLPDQPAAAPPSRRTLLTATIPAAAALIGVGALSFPRPASLGEPTGDTDLAAAVAPHLKGHQRVAVKLRDPSGATRFAGFGSSESDEFEIGSVTKTFTGALLACAIEEGEVSAETTVEEILGGRASGSEVADVTLAELATHTSGLPRLASAALWRATTADFLRHDPYAGRDAQTVIDDALASSLSGRGTSSYSNLGVALQGQLLAAAAGTDYASLLQARILEPAQLTGTYAPITPENLRETHRRGHGASGLPQAAWTMEGQAPAGGICSTAADMMTYVTGMIDGSGPGAAAATEVLHEGEDTIVAMNWFHNVLDEEADTRLIWHNGQTGGYSSFAGFRPDTGQGVVVLTDSARPVDGLGAGLLTGEVAA